MELVRKDPDTTVLSDPTQMSDELATRLGLKVYSHGTSYNGGNAPTVASAQTGFSVVYGNFIPYQTQNGVWYLKAAISATFASATISSVLVSIAGITSKATSLGQTLVGHLTFTGVPVGAAHRGVHIPSANNQITVSISGSTSATGVNISGDIELASKPTWAY